MNRFLFLFLLVSFHAAAQTSIPFDSPRWSISAKNAGPDKWFGQDCLKLMDGAVMLKDADFKNGTIEFDMAISKARYFPGIGFRMQDGQNGEIFYLRPHQSGNPDAMQYYPEYNGSGGWQLYYGEGFNHPRELPVDRWIHLKILVLGNQAEIYFDREQTPELTMRLRRPIRAGMIELENPWPEIARYANFRMEATDAVHLSTSLKKPDPLPHETITRWSVSSPFDEGSLKNKTSIDPADSSMYQWQILDADERGITDISELATLAPRKNTVFAKTVFTEEKAAIKKLSFGFSDRVRVFLNGKLLYAGADEFRSRDYRFLGTVGYWDALYLDLKKGRNELWFAISEDTGGWGLLAKLDPL